MKRTIALPLLVIAFDVSVIFASRTPRLIAGELPREETENPPLLTLTEDVGGQAVTLEVYEPNEEGFAHYVLLDTDGTQIDRGSESLGGNKASECFALTAADDVLGFPGIEVTSPLAGYMIRHAYYALTEHGFVYTGESYGHDFGAALGDGAWPVGRSILTATGAASWSRAAPSATAYPVSVCTVGTPRVMSCSIAISTGKRRNRGLRA